MLIEKLRIIGFEGKLLNWFKNYLTIRKLTVKIDGCFSELADLEYGIPQGSIWGPKCFIIYINWLVRVCVNTKAFFYADDTLLLAVGASVEEAER